MFEALRVRGQVMRYSNCYQGTFYVLLLTYYWELSAVISDMDNSIIDFIIIIFSLPGGIIL